MTKKKNYRNLLRPKPTWPLVINELAEEPNKIYRPDRRATHLRNSHLFTQLDGEGMRQYEARQLQSKQKEIDLKKQAVAEHQPISHLRAVMASSSQAGPTQTESQTQTPATQLTTRKKHNKNMKKYKKLMVV